MLKHQNDKPTAPERVVIVGAGGFIGRAVARRLTKDKIPTLSLTRKDVDLLADGSGAKLEALLKPTDAVVVISAIAPAKNVGMLMQNLRMMEQVSGALAGAPVAHVVYISSDAIYCDEANPVVETSAPAPTTLHGMMHAARELMLRTSTKAPFAALRPTLVYGAGDPHNGYGPNRFRREAQKGQPVKIFGDGEEQRDHVLVEDVAEIVALTLTHRSSGALNVATGVSTSFCDIAKIVAGQYGVAVESQPRPGPRPHLVHRFFDVAACRKAFPEFQYTPLAEGLERARREEAK